MFNKKTILSVESHGKRVLVRVDFNVPMAGGKVTDDTRLHAALPTITYLQAQGAKIILCSHLGRPKGCPDPEFSLEPVAEYLKSELDLPVRFVNDCIGPAVQDTISRLEPGAILLLENTRFYAEEEQNDREFSRKLADLAEIYVDDAFGSAHRAHASTCGVAEFLPAYAGFLMEKEIRYLGNVISSPEHPFNVILGGKKVSDKIGVIQSLLKKADQILIGGGMSNTFLRAQGYSMGDSLVEEACIQTAQELIITSGERLHLPVDLVIADRFDPDAAMRTVPTGSIPEDWRVMDIGPDTIYSYKKWIQPSKTLFWNGPMGVFEYPRFAVGTFKLAHAVGSCRGVTIIGGGDSAAAIHQAGLENQISHISTGGGASLELLEGKTLPGLEVLLDEDPL